MPYRCNDEHTVVNGQAVPYLLEGCDPATGDFEVLHDCSAESTSDGGCACELVYLGAGPGHEVHCHIACAWDGAVCNGLDGWSYDVPCE
jgi:hypothetical protein